jgi:pyruvate dehydrogenase E2 component (dihydrolipoamide acetyltransferase)
MAFEFRFPDVGEGIHEGRIVEWLIKEGDEVQEDQTILKVETDKAVVDLPAPKAGKVLKINFDQDATIRVGDLLLVIGADGEKVEAQPASATKDNGSGAERVKEDSAGEVILRPAPEKAFHRPPATPHTRALARKLGVDLAIVEGTGKNGRITDEDVRGVAEMGGKAPSPQLQGTKSKSPTPIRRQSGELEERVPLTHLRKVISEAMLASKKRSAHVTHVDEADVTELFNAYKTNKALIAKKSEVKFSILPYFIKALSVVLKDHPVFNASFDEEREEIILKNYLNLGLAVDTDEGLIVPVLKDADQKDMLSLAEEIQDLATRARSRSLKLDELKGGSFTVTNIGPLGGVFATPIINQPEIAILGLHTMKDRPLVHDGEIKIRKHMFVSISFDHRIIDGAQAARFMSDFVELISNPTLLMARL